MAQPSHGPPDPSVETFFVLFSSNRLDERFSCENQTPTCHEQRFAAGTSLSGLRLAPNRGDVAAHFLGAAFFSTMPRTKSGAPEAGEHEMEVVEA